jgi:hypothetical protein
MFYIDLFFKFMWVCFASLTVLFRLFAGTRRDEEKRINALIWSDTCLIMVIVSLFIRYILQPGVHLV